MQRVSANNIQIIFWPNALFNWVKICFVQNCPPCPRIALSKNCPVQELPYVTLPPGKIKVAKLTMVNIVATAGL